MAGGETTNKFQAYLTAGSKVIHILKKKKMSCNPGSFTLLCKVKLPRTQTSVKRTWNSRQSISRSNLYNLPVLSVLMIFQMTLLLEVVGWVEMSINAF